MNTSLLSVESGQGYESKFLKNVNLDAECLRTERLYRVPGSEAQTALPRREWAHRLNDDVEPDICSVADFTEVKTCIISTNT